jgi:protein deglycase
MKNVCVFFATGFEEVEAMAIVDVLRRANIPVTMVSLTGSFEITGAHQISVVADQLFEDVNFDEAAMLVLPGGMPGAKNLSLHEGLKKQILKFNENNMPLGAICAAPLVFGELGILEGKEATSYPGFESFLKGAKLSKATVVTSGNIVTGKGPGVAISFALKIVESLKGKELADTIGRNMIAE